MVGGYFISHNVNNKELKNKIIYFYSKMLKLTTHDCI